MPRRSQVSVPPPSFTLSPLQRALDQVYLEAYIKFLARQQAQYLSEHKTPSP